MTHMSRIPDVPARSLLKKSKCPSRDSAGMFSTPGVLTMAPTFNGGPHGLCTEARCETQMSLAPNPPGRIDPKYKLRPSFEIAGPCSPTGELIWHPRFVGSAQSESWGAAVT